MDWVVLTENLIIDTEWDGFFMTSRRYDLIANICVGIAVVSAIAFDHVGQFRWLIGSAGILAGLLAAGSYFCNQWCSDSDRKNEDKSDNKNPELNQAKEPKLPLITNFDVPLEKIVHSWVAQGDLFSVEPTLFWAGSAVPLHYWGVEPRAVSRMSQLWVTSEQSEFVDDVVEIINRLSSNERISYEFEFRPDGTFTIRTIHAERSPALNKPSLRVIRGRLSE